VTAAEEEEKDKVFDAIHTLFNDKEGERYCL
jgi:hypothetical protein